MACLVLLVGEPLQSLRNGFLGGRFQRGNGGSSRQIAQGQCQTSPQQGARVITAKGQVVRVKIQDGEFPIFCQAFFCQALLRTAADEFLADSEQAGLPFFFF